MFSTYCFSLASSTASVGPLLLIAGRIHESRRDCEERRIMSTVMTNVSGDVTDGVLTRTQKLTGRLESLARWWGWSSLYHRDQLMCAGQHKPNFSTIGCSSQLCFLRYALMPTQSSLSVGLLALIQISILSKSLSPTDALSIQACTGIVRRWRGAYNKMLNRV